jgi:succinyl-CoA synthetase beta subunit
MVREVRAFHSLTGLRGKQRGDLEALARAVSALSQLATRADLPIAEAEVNPLMILPEGEGEGVLAVDALILQS